MRRTSLRINESRIEEISKIIREIGIDKILLLEETDPQLHAVTRVSRLHGVGWAAATSVGVALVSYRLAMKGEEWWRCYSDFFSEKEPAPTPQEAALKVIEFLEKCPGAVIQREAKKRRAMKAFSGARNVFEVLLRDPHRILSSGRWLLEGLAKALSQEPWRKTIVFSAKMAYYSVRGTLSTPIPAPWDVPIPVDLRISCITYSSGLIDAPNYKAILKEPLLAIEVWSRISKESGVPPLNLDSLLWLIGWAPRDLSLEKARSSIIERLYPYLGATASIFAEEITLKRCL